MRDIKVKVMMKIDKYKEVEVVVKSRHDRWRSKKCGSGGQITKISLCGSSSGSGGEQEAERESKRKEWMKTTPLPLILMPQS